MNFANTRIFNHPSLYGTHKPRPFRLPVPESVRTLAEKHEFDKNEGQYLSLGDRILELYHSAFQMKDESDDRWHFHRILGYGSFGIAALYQKMEWLTNVMSPDGRVVAVSKHTNLTARGG